jgi:hypothetical protein
MLEAFKEGSKLLVVPTALLYLLGFLCVTGYYGQFGIVTFEIANARFLIAGMLVAVALGFAAFGAWRLCEHVANAILSNRLSNIRTRLWLYAAVVFYPWFFGVILTLLLSISQRGTVGSRLQLKLTPMFGSFDFVGGPLAKLFGTPNDLAWIAFYSANLAGWMLIAWILVEAGRELAHLMGFKMIVGNRSEAKSALTLQASTEVDGQAVSVAAPALAARSDAPQARLIRALDIAAISVLVILFVYSTAKIYSEIFDLQTVGATLTLNIGLTFAWQYSATIFLFILFAPMVRRDQPTALRDLAKEFLNFDRFSDVFQYVVVPLVALVFFFGATIFPRIPFSLGGGEPREVRVLTSVGEWQSGKKVYLLGESSEFLFLITTDGQDARSFELNKREVVEVRTRSTSITPALMYVF